MSRRKKPRKERGKRKPAARWRGAKKLAIAALVWLVSTISAVTLGHYISVLMNW